MTHKITISDQLYMDLQDYARRHGQQPDALVEIWLKQHLNLEAYPDLEWRQGAGGWRIGIRNTAIDAHTVIGYAQVGYSAQEIADELLPHLSLANVQAALSYYAEYPDEIDQILAESETETTKANLFRMVGPAGYRQLTGLSIEPQSVREARPGYTPDGETNRGPD